MQEVLLHFDNALLLEELTQLDDAGKLPPSKLTKKVATALTHRLEKVTLLPMCTSVVV